MANSDVNAPVSTDPTTISTVLPVAIIWSLVLHIAQAPVRNTDALGWDMFWDSASRTVELRRSRKFNLLVTYINRTSMENSSLPNSK